MSDNPSAFPASFPAVPGFDIDLLDKFTDRIDAGDWSMGHCWNWTGHITDRGYGVFAPTKKAQYRAHRFALHAYLGREPVGMALHSCDNRACVNPAHLTEGNHLENMAQMAERRRAARGPRHPKSKLTDTKALAINILSAGGDFSTRELAAMFGVHQSNIAAMITGKIWPDAYELAAHMLAARKGDA